MRLYKIYVHSIGYNHKNRRNVTTLPTLTLLTTKVQNVRGQKRKLETKGPFANRGTHNSVTTSPFVAHLQGGPKKVSLRSLHITSSNTGRFSKFFHCHILQEICNKVIIKYSTSPQTCRYTTL